LGYSEVQVWEYIIIRIPSDSWNPQVSAPLQVLPYGTYMLLYWIFSGVKLLIGKVVNLQVNVKLFSVLLADAVSKE
jgi:hypothetical protein